MGLGGLCEEGARLQFYGCKVGLGPEGQAYVNETGQNAGMSVDAWTDNTEHCPKRGAVPSGDKVSFEFKK
jgi:hypothetical protein